MTPTLESGGLGQENQLKLLTKILVLGETQGKNVLQTSKEPTWNNGSNRVTSSLDDSAEE